MEEQGYIKSYGEEANVLEKKIIFQIFVC